MNILQKDPTSLRPLPAIKAFPRWAKDTLEWSAFVEDIREHGIKNPIQITADDQVVDGETRRLAAKQLQLKEVPCVLVGPDEINAIILREVTLRRNMTKSQRAYTLCPLVESAYAESRRRKVENLKNTKSNSSITNSVGHRGKGLQEWLAEFGFSDELMRQVRWLYDQIKAYPDPVVLGDEPEPQHLKDWVERNLFDPDKPMGIGAINKAVGYFIEVLKHPNKATGGSPQDPDKQLELFNRVVADQMARWDYWQKFDADTKASHFKKIRIKAATLPLDRCKELADYHKRLAKEFTAAVKAREKQK